MSPKGLTFASCAAVVFSTSLAAWSDCLMGSGKPVGFCFSPSYGFCFRCLFSSLACLCGRLVPFVMAILCMSFVLYSSCFSSVSCMELMHDFVKGYVYCNSGKYMYLEVRII